MALPCNNTQTLEKKKKNSSADLTFSVMDYTTERTLNSLVIDFRTDMNRNHRMQEINLQTHSEVWNSAACFLKQSKAAMHNLLRADTTSLHNWKHLIIVPTMEIQPVQQQSGAFPWQ